MSTVTEPGPRETTKLTLFGTNMVRMMVAGHRHHSDGPERRKQPMPMMSSQKRREFTQEDNPNRLRIGKITCRTSRHDSTSPTAEDLPIQTSRSTESGKDSLKDVEKDSRGLATAHSPNRLRIMRNLVTTSASSPGPSCQKIGSIGYLKQKISRRLSDGLFGGF